MTRWDVHNGNESPTTRFLERFQNALVHAEGTQADTTGSDHRRPGPLEALRTWQSEPRALYTYPMVLLSNVPTIPDDSELDWLDLSFPTTFKRHILVNQFATVGETAGLLPPYLQIARACIAYASFSSEEKQARATTDGIELANAGDALFTAGAHLWAVMLEVDNREARMLEAVVAAVLLVTYGLFSNERRVRKKSAGLLCNVVTISRRLHLHDGSASGSTHSEVFDRDQRTRTSLFAYLLLLDMLQAARSGDSPMYSTTELHMRMHGSDVSFRLAYSSIIHGYALPEEIKSREDALVLLTAIMSDSLYAQRTHFLVAENNLCGSSAASASSPRTPYLPLTAKSESARLSAVFEAALLRWHRQFERSAGSALLVLYYFAQLQQLCPGSWQLPAMAGHGVLHTTKIPEHLRRDHAIPEQAVETAWQILEHFDQCLQSPDGRLAIWLPMSLFMSALVVWRHISLDRSRRGTLKMLDMFKIRLTELPWPCCTEMVRTLARLSRPQSDDA